MEWVDTPRLMGIPTVHSDIHCPSWVETGYGEMERGCRKCTREHLRLGFGNITGMELGGMSFSFSYMLQSVCCTLSWNLSWLAGLTPSLSNSSTTCLSQMHILSKKIVNKRSLLALSLFEYCFSGRMLQRSLLSSCQAGPPCMLSTPSWWCGCWWLVLGSVDGLAWPTSLGRWTRSDSSQSAINASQQEQHHRVLTELTSLKQISPKISSEKIFLLLHILYHTKGK